MPLLLLALACESGGGAEPAAVVRDSAGVAIVEHAPTASATLHIVSEPVLEIGTVEGADEYQLYGVRSVARASDGTIVVALDTELRWYDPAGRFVRRAGGAGEGPGEFRRISYMRLLPGDTVLVFDGANRRTTIIAPDGSHVRDFTSGDEGQISTIVGATHDGTLLVRRFTAGSTSITSGLQRNDVEFSIVRGDSTIADPTYPGPEMMIQVDQDGGGQIASIMIMQLPFARDTRTAAGPDRFFIGSTESYRIDVWSADGAMVRSIRVNEPVRAVTDDMVRMANEVTIERSRAVAESRGDEFDEAALRKRLAGQQHAPFVPAYGVLLPVEDGGLWVQEYAMPSIEDEPTRWTMFDPDGGRIGMIELPPRFSPRYVSGDTVLGIHLDELDVQYVRAYTFSPAGG